MSRSLKKGPYIDPKLDKKSWDLMSLKRRHTLKLGNVDL